jgi:hypothetical protein
MILPKGIVVNTKDVYKEVASFPVLPNDKIRGYWHVYTITNKKLRDPTARRLENFWWHVWGSDRSQLSGRVLARLYEDISLGLTFVPLKGPSNRWEGPDAPQALQQPVPANHVDRLASPRPDTREPSPDAKSSDSGLKSHVSSASKPRPSHPILKKARGPSSSGPRPTARFVSPPESADEDDPESQMVSSGSTAATGLELRKPAPSPAKKKATGSTRKFVAGASTAKRRPVMPRRMSSQSSTTSKEPEVGSRESVSVAGSKSSLTQRAVSPVSETFSQQPSNGSTNSQPVASLQSNGLSAKAAGKRPTAQRRLTTDKSGTSRQEAYISPTNGSVSLEDQNTSIRQAQSMVSLPGLSEHSASRSKTRKSGPANGTNPLEELISPMAMARSQSHQGYERPSDFSNARVPNQGLFTGATASTTNIAAQGTIIDQSGLGSMPIPSAFSRRDDDILPQHRQSFSSILDSRLTPTQPSPLASVPLARTRSQLTLLLEREKSRMGNKPRSRS